MFRSVWCVVVLLAAPVFADEGAGDEAAWRNRLAERARAALTEALTGERDFVRIHAGEAWADLGEKGLAYRAFLGEAAEGDERYRLGAWRVLAMAAHSEAATEPWVRRIGEVVTKPDDPRFLLAIESLNKLERPLTASQLAVVREERERVPEAAAVFLDWACHLAGEAGALERIEEALSSTVPAARSRAAFVLRLVRPSGETARVRLAEALRREPSETMARVFLLGAALTLDASRSEAVVWREELESVLAAGPDAARYQAAQALMSLSGTETLPQWERLLATATGDPKVALAWGILHILARAGRDITD